MNKKLFALLFVAVCGSASAQMTPVGLWRSIDDQTSKPKAEIRITAQSGGVLSGVVERAITTEGDPICNLCTDDRKGKSKVGMEIIRDARQTEGKDVWEGGTVLDPESGTVYRLKMTPIDGGKKLEVRGFVGFALLGRTQTWIRVQ